MRSTPDEADHEDRRSTVPARASVPSAHGDTDELEPSSPGRPRDR